MPARQQIESLDSLGEFMQYHEPAEIVRVGAPGLGVPATPPRVIAQS